MPFALAAIRNITKNSSIAVVLYFAGQLIDFRFFLDLIFKSAINSPLYFFLLLINIFAFIKFRIFIIPFLVKLILTFLIINSESSDKIVSTKKKEHELISPGIL